MLRAARGKVGKGKLEMQALKLLPRAKGKPSVELVAKQVSMSELEALIAQWEDKLQSVGDDAQLANIDLQNALQQQQQTLQTISSVSKMLHDTALAVIRNIG